MRAFVTGGAGFIGSNLVDALVERGDDVVVLDDLSTGRALNLSGAVARGAELIADDVSDRAALDRAISDFRPDAVFHLAAQVDVRISVGDPGRDARINVEGTVNALDAAQRAGAGRFVLASSCAAYGEPELDQLPLGEGAPTRPGSPYGQAKLAAEGYVSLYRRLHGMHATSLRFGNVYGPRQGAVGEAGVVSIFCRQLVAGETPVVFGTGRQTRDFVYVGDVVAALLAAADGATPGEYNVATAVETSVLELIDELTAIAGQRGLVPTMQPPRAGEVERMALDWGLAAEHLGWEPRMPLSEGLRRTFDAIEAEPAAV